MVRNMAVPDERRERRFYQVMAAKILAMFVVDTGEKALVLPMK